MMGLVYYHSYLTICPLCSHSCLQTFISPRPDGLNLDFQPTRHSNIQGVLTLYEGHNDQDVNNELREEYFAMDVLPPFALD